MNATAPPSPVVTEPVTTVEAPVTPKKSSNIPFVDTISYLFVLGGIYLTFGFLFFYAGKEKLFTDNANMPAGLAKVYHGSFVASFPGLNTSWLIIGLLEFGIFLLFAASLITGEFLIKRRKPLMLTGLSLSILVFGLIGFSENMIGNFATTAEIFSYFAGTVVTIILVLLLPPYRPARWLSSLGHTHEEE
jgi:hypothetical protein